MTVKVNFAKPSMGVSEGTVVRWLRNIGDTVSEGEIIVEIETAKAVQEIPAPVTGVLVEILAPESEEVLVNSTLAIIEPL